MGEHLPGANICRLTEFFHLSPYVAPVQGIAVPGNKDRSGPYMVLPCVGQQQFFQLPRNQYYPYFPLAMDLGTPAPYCFHSDILKL